MSGAVAAHAAYNGKGTQGLAVTDKPDSNDENQMSVFWNKNDWTRQLLYGSSVVEIPSSGASTLNYGSSRLFTVNNDIDCLGDMYLQLEATFPTYTATTTAFGLTEVPVTLVPEPFALQRLIERVEIQVGTQIWQTLEREDIRVVNAHEMPPDAFAGTAKLSTPTAYNSSTKAWLVIPSFVRTLGSRLEHFSNHTEDGYPIAVAPHQSVKIKVVFVEPLPDKLTFKKNPSTLYDGLSALTVVLEQDVPFSAVLDLPNAGGGSFDNASAAGDVAEKDIHNPGSITSCLLFAKQQIMCNEERANLKSQKMPKRLKMTQNSFTSDIGSSVTKTIDLDHFSLYTSHLIISGDAGLDSNSKPIRLKTAELKLNSSSYSGQLPGILLESCTSDSIGVYANKFIFTSAEAGANNASFTVTMGTADGNGRYPIVDASFAYGGSVGFLPNTAYSIQLTDTVTGETAANVVAITDSDGTFAGATGVGLSPPRIIIHEAGAYNASAGPASAVVTPDVRTIDVKEFGMGTYLFPLASTAFSGSSVPLNRFDSVRLTLTFTSTPTVAAGTFVNVTCIGETTAIFQDGGATLTMY